MEQGGLPTDELRERAAVWGAQLTVAGVTVNLTPVADIVTSPDVAEQNAPIGALLRNYGYDAATVAAQAGAFVDGMRRAAPRRPSSTSRGSAARPRTPTTRRAWWMP